MLSVAGIDLGQMIEAAGAHSAVVAIGDRFGITDARMTDIIARTGAPFFCAYRQWIERPGGLDKLNELVRSGGPQQFADRAELVRASVSRQEGRVYLKYLFPDDRVLRTVTQRIASRLGIDPQKLAKMMPNLAALFIGVLCKSIAR